MAPVAAGHFFAVSADAVVHAFFAQNSEGEFFDACCHRRRLLGSREKHQVGPLSTHGKRFKRFAQTRRHLVGRLELGRNLKLVRRLFDAQPLLLGLNRREQAVEHVGCRSLYPGHRSELHPTAFDAVWPWLAQQSLGVRNQRPLHKRQHKIVFESAQNGDVAALVGVAGLAPLDLFNERSLQHQCPQKIEFGVPAGSVLKKFVNLRIHALKIA